MVIHLIVGFIIGLVLAIIAGAFRSWELHGEETTFYDYLYEFVDGNKPETEFYEQPVDDIITDCDDILMNDGDYVSPNAMPAIIEPEVLDTEVIDPNPSPYRKSWLSFKMPGLKVSDEFLHDLPGGSEFIEERDRKRIDNG